MTNEEAVKVAGIIKTADGGCSHCYFQLVEKLQEYIPEFNWKELVNEAPELWGTEED